MAADLKLDYKAMAADEAEGQLGKFLKQNSQNPRDCKTLAGAGNAGSGTSGHVRLMERLPRPQRIKMCSMYLQH